MPNIIYRFPLSTRALNFLGVCFFGYLALFARLIPFDHRTSATFCFMPCMLAFGVMLISSSYEVEVSEQSISTSFLGKKKSLRWDEIVCLEMQLGIGLDLYRDGTNRVFINTQVEGYPKLVALIHTKRPDLWKADNIKVFHQSRAWFIIVGVAGLGLASLSLKVLIDESRVVGLTLLAVVIGATGSILYLLSTQLQRLILAERELILKYLFWERRIRLETIKTIALSQAPSRPGAGGQAVLLKLADGKELRLNGFKQGSPILYNALEAWSQNYRKFPE